MTNQIVDVHFLAELWGVTIRTIQNYADPEFTEDPLPRDKRGEYDLILSVKWMYNRQKRECEILKASGDEELHKHKIQNQLIKNQREEISLKKELAQLVDKQETLIAVSNLMSVVNSQLNSLKYETLRVLNISDPKQVAQITLMYEDAKETLSNYNVEKMIQGDDSWLDITDASESDDPEL